tara:strand:- start:1134 stop:1427 length:294 start_codon:yes stop_codon:yes gene_type:complete
MACYDVTALQHGIHATIALNIDRVNQDLHRNYGEYHDREEARAAQVAEEARLNEARTNKTAALLSDAYLAKQRRIKQEHVERARHKKDRRVKFEQQE